MLEVAQRISIWERVNGDLEVAAHPFAQPSLAVRVKVSGMLRATVVQAGQTLVRQR
jgi:hypothetical protein